LRTFAITWERRRLAGEPSVLPRQLRFLKLGHYFGRRCPNLRTFAITWERWRLAGEPPVLPRQFRHLKLGHYRFQYFVRIPGRGKGRAAIRIIIQRHPPGKLKRPEVTSGPLPITPSEGAVVLLRAIRTPRSRCKIQIPPPTGIGKPQEKHEGQVDEGHGINPAWETACSARILGRWFKSHGTQFTAQRRLRIANLIPLDP